MILTANHIATTHFNQAATPYWRSSVASHGGLFLLNLQRGMKRNERRIERVEWV